MDRGFGGVAGRGRVGDGVFLPCPPRHGRLHGSLEPTGVVMNPKDIVRRGYDRISYQYRDDDGLGPAQPGQPEGRPDYEGWLAELMPLLHDGDTVLDLGCGCGVPATAILAEHYAVTGVDLSPIQIARARRLVPAAAQTRRFAARDRGIQCMDWHRNRLAWCADVLEPRRSCHVRCLARGNGVRGPLDPIHTGRKRRSHARPRQDPHPALPRKRGRVIEVRSRSIQ